MVHVYEMVYVKKEEKIHVKQLKRTKMSKNK